MTILPYISWELTVTVLGLIILLIDILLPQFCKIKLSSTASLSLGILFILTLLFPPSTPSSKMGNLALDQLAIWGKQFAILATALTVFISTRFFRMKTEYLSEFTLIQLATCVGMMFVCSATDFPTLFISLELMTVCFYVLVSFQKNNVLSLEAGLKYLIYGALASGIMLYGMALIYGATGQIHFEGISQFISSNPQSTLLLTGFSLLLVGVAFKISAFPFHWWTADVYEGAPTPTTALLSVGSKTAGFVILIRILFGAFLGYKKFWFALICGASMGSILFGNLGALSQGNLKRVMGYSSISHSGYLLLGIAASSVLGFSAIFYYLAGYLLANILIFGVMCEVESPESVQDIREYSGLGNRSALAAGAMTIGLLSLSGIPPLAGFFGKLMLFGATFNQLIASQARVWILLLSVAGIGVVCSLYYYLNIIRTIYFSPQSEEESSLQLSRSIRWVLVLLIVGLFVIGFYQSPWWSASEKVAASIPF